MTSFHKQKKSLIGFTFSFGFSALLVLGSVSVKTQAQETINILPLGDSITQGGNERPSYRRTLWLKLQQHGFNVDFVGSQQAFHNASPPEKRLDFDLDHEGHWGWETNEIVESLPGWLESYTADIALVHLGTNDFDRGEDVLLTLEDLKQVLAILRQSNPDITVLLAKIVPMRFKNTRKFNDALVDWAGKQSTLTSKVVLVDQHAGYYPLFYNYDKYHPNSWGEERMADRWFEALIPILEPKSDSAQ